MSTHHSSKEQSTHQLFAFSITLKGLFSIFEIISGILTYLIPPAVVTNFLLSISDTELAEDKYDFITTRLVDFAHSFSVQTSTFIAFYLLSRGLIKIGLVIALLKNKLWAYPLSLAVLGLFIAYQLYQIYTTHSLLVIGITLFDFVVLYFIWKEYKYVRAKVQQ